MNVRLEMQRARLPSASSVPGRIVWVGGLGALAAFGAIDWPVAAVVVAGTWVAEQRAKEQRAKEQRRAEPVVAPED